MPDGVASLYFILTIFGGVFVPLVCFVVIRRGVDCVFSYLEYLGVWDTHVTADDRVNHTRHQANILVDGIVLSETHRDTGLAGAVTGCTDHGSPRQHARLSTCTCIAEREPLRDAPQKGANHQGLVRRGDVFEVLETITDPWGINRSFIRLESSGKVGWIRSSTFACYADTTGQGLDGATAADTVGSSTAGDTQPAGRRSSGNQPARAARLSDTCARVTAQSELPHSQVACSLVEGTYNSGESAAVGVRRWLAQYCLSEDAVVSGACKALNDAGVPPQEWVSELLKLHADGSLQHWIGLVRAQSTQPAAGDIVDV